MNANTAIRRGILFGLFLLALLAGQVVTGRSGGLQSAASPRSEWVDVEGTLANGVECPGLRTDEGTFYTLAGDLHGFENGDRVRVIGTVAELSICQQGITVNVRWIAAAR
jgi:hypothetical protein